MEKKGGGITVNNEKGPTREKKSKGREA